MSTTGRIHIGAYRLVRQIRSGQSCQVWLAINTLNERVALKVLKDEFRKNREETSQLRHEYTVGHDLEHPNVIRVIEFSVADRIPFLALEYCGAQNIKQVIQDGLDLFAPRVPETVRQCAQGLAYLNNQGWLHRDVKPDNFMIDEGNTKLIDFSLAVKAKKGLSRLLGGRSKVQGTRSYMSPEQIRGEVLDVRSDVYSFGCTLFEMLTGRPPFTAESADELLIKHLKAAVPSLLVTANNITEEFADLVARCLAKNVQERPESLDDFLIEFDHMKVFMKPPVPLGNDG